MCRTVPGLCPDTGKLHLPPHPHPHPAAAANKRAAFASAISFKHNCHGSSTARQAGKRAHGASGGTRGSRTTHWHQPWMAGRLGRFCSSGSSLQWTRPSFAAPPDTRWAAAEPLGLGGEAAALAAVRRCTSASSTTAHGGTPRLLLLSPEPTLRCSGADSRPSAGRQAHPCALARTTTMGCRCYCICDARRAFPPQLEQVYTPLSDNTQCSGKGVGREVRWEVRVGWPQV